MEIQRSLVSHAPLRRRPQVVLRRLLERVSAETSTGEPAAELEGRVAPYRSGKDSVRFRHSQELPYDLVGEICDEVLRRR